MKASKADMIRTFGLVLEPDSIAEEWWSKVDAANKTTWAAVRSEFRVEWPPT
jgi:hypothetical protein